MTEETKFLIGMDHECWNINFPIYCKKVNDIIPDADGFELNFEHPDLFRLFPSNEVVKYINDTISSYNFKYISMHSPTRDINISSYNPRIRKTSFNELIKSIELFSKLDADKLLYFLIHGGQNSFRSRSRFGKRNLPTSISNHIENVIRLNDICKDYGIPLTIENLIYSKWRLASKTEYLDALFNEIKDIKFAYDIDHAAFVSFSYARKMLKKYMKRINVVHVGVINYFHKFQKHIIPVNPLYVFEPHSIKNKTQLFQYLNRNVKTVKNEIKKNKNPEITVS
ncbi:MAG: TIM barrel protein [Candidatus Lokiarchaeota archaeon]|nr:TIM barrel protein [Candidatus Lokiarchaeota archaeon]